MNMINYFFTKFISNKDSKKDILYKELFTSSRQKKNVTRAAKESADDQKKVVEVYRHSLETSRI